MRRQTKVYVPEFILTIIDEYAEKWKLPRSRTLQRIVMEYVDGKK